MFLLINNDLEAAHPRSGSSFTYFPVEIGIWKCFFEVNPGTLRISLGAKERTSNKLYPHMASTPGFETVPYLSEASALTTAPSLHPT